MWKGYSEEIFAEHGSSHEVVNHSIEFKDSVSGVHTNTIEGTWSGVKDGLKKRKRGAQFVNDELWRFIWERQNKGNRWQMLLLAIKCTFYEDIKMFA